MRRCLVGCVTLGLLAGAAGAAGSEKVTLGEPVDFPNVGLRVAFPASVRRGHIDHPAGLLVCWQGQAEPADCVKLYAYPFYHRLDVPPLAEWARKVVSATADTGEQVKEVELSSAGARFGGLAAWQIATRLTRPGQTRVRVWTVFAVKRPKLKLTFYYPLLVMVEGDDPSLARARAKAVCESVQVTPVKSPAALPLPELMLPAEFAQQGFRLKLPAGWFVQKATPTRYRSVVLHAAAMDHLRRKRLPFLSVAVDESDLPKPPDVTSEGYIKGAAARLEANFWKAKMVVTSTRKTKLAGLAALEIASHFQQDGPDYCQVQRQCYRGKTFYTLAIMYPGRDPRPAAAALEKIAATFEFVEQPATRPAATQEAATQPALSPKPAGGPKR